MEGKDAIWQFKGFSSEHTVRVKPDGSVETIEGKEEKDEKDEKGNS